MEKISVDLGYHSYEIVIGKDILGDLGERLHLIRAGRGFSNRGLLISNKTVFDLYGDKVVNSLIEKGMQIDVALIPDGEEYKSLATAANLYDKAIECQLDRKSFIVALGGGVIGDISGFIASTYMRGIPFIQIPTTLLAQVDSSVGGKVAVNHPKGKNIIGAFYQPQLVWADIQVLQSLPEREFAAGLAEVVKYGVIWESEFFAYLEEHSKEVLARDTRVLVEIIRRSCKIKAQIVEQDEKEGGIRAILNLGHTFGHAYESLTGYKQYLHGEAVAIGMVLAFKVAQELNWLDQACTDRLMALLKRFNLPTFNEDFSGKELLQTMELDKKAEGGQIKYVLPKTIGRVVVTKDIPRELIEKVLIPK